MSTVHICLNDILGVAVACEVIFYPGDTPFFNGSALAVSGARSIRLDAGGNGSVTLLPGRYAVRFSGIISNTDTLLILVPGEEGEYQLPELICGGNWVLPLRDFLQKARDLSDVADPATAFDNIKQTATTAIAGVVSLATQAEVDAGTDTEKCVTPATLANATGMGQVHVITVPDMAGRFALTPAQIHVGDLVEQTDTHAVYQALDTALLRIEAGYVEIGTRATVPETGLMQGLLAFWKMDEETGLRVDATGNGNDLSDTNAVGFDLGKYGNAAAFDGTNSLSAASPIIAGDSDFTIAAWIKPSEFNSYNIVASNFPLVSFGLNSGYVHFYAGGPNDCNGDLVTINEWSLITFRREGDSCFASVNAGTPATIGATNTEAPANFTIGQEANREGYFKGLVDEIGVWNRALSDAEISELYNNGNGISYPFA